MGIVAVKFAPSSHEDQTGLTTKKLLTSEVGVVRGINEVMREGLVHVLADVKLVLGDKRVLLTKQVAQEPLLGQVPWNRWSNNVTSREFSTLNKL